VASLLVAGRGGLLTLEGSDGAGDSDAGGRAELSLALPEIFGSGALTGGAGFGGANSTGGVLFGGTRSGGGADGGGAAATSGARPSGRTFWGGAGGGGV